MKENRRYAAIDEPQLVQLAGFGDISAFDELARRYRKALWFEARKACRTDGDAEDAVQDALLSAYKALPSLREPSRFPAWIRAIARNRAQRISEGEKRHTTALDELILRNSRNLAGELLETRIALNDELRRLPEDLGLALHLHYFEEWPVARIATYFSLSESNVKWRLSQGRKRLRSRLAPGENHEPPE